MKSNRVYFIIRSLVDGTVPSVHKEKVLRWLTSDVDYKEKEEVLNRLWLDTEAEADENIGLSLAATHRKINQGNIKKKSSLSLNRLLRYAAMLLLPILTGLGGWLVAEDHFADNEMVRFYVPNGHSQKVFLPDGSEVQVNAGTLLIYPQKFNGNERSLYLMGEANFSVIKDKDKPFVVHAGELDIQVLGTKFNVEAYPGTGKITTVLEQGSVRVYRAENPNESVFMKVNEQLTYSDSNNSFSTASVDASESSAWTAGELRFSNHSLSEILSKIERRYDVRIKLSPEVNTEDLFTVKFRENETIDDVFRVLTQLTSNITYRKRGNEILLFAKGKEGVKK